MEETGKKVKVIGKVGGSSARKKWHDQSILIEVLTALQNKFHFDFLKHFNLLIYYLKKNFFWLCHTVCRILVS